MTNNSALCCLYEQTLTIKKEMCVYFIKPSNWREFLKVQLELLLSGSIEFTSVKFNRNNVIYNQ